MKQIKTFLAAIGWIDLPRIAPKISTCPDETCRLWGIPSLYQAHPDLIGR